MFRERLALKKRRALETRRFTGADSLEIGKTYLCDVCYIEVFANVLMCYIACSGTTISSFQSHIKNVLNA